jgi:hypothetical protein
LRLEALANVANHDAHKRRNGRAAKSSRAAQPFEVG